MRWFTLIALSALAMTSFASAEAQECDPSQFTFEEVESFKFSDALQLSAWDIMEQSAQSNNSKGFDLGAVIYGAPVNVGYDEAKAASSYMKRNSGLTFSREQQLDYFRTNVSLVGKQMYEACLDRLTREFRVIVPENAYFEDSFLIEVQWTPTGSLADRKDQNGVIQVRVGNGTVEGQEVAEATVEDEKSASFLIERRDKTKSLQIIPTVNGIRYGAKRALVLPPVVDLQYEAVLRTWPGDGGGFSPMCSDDGGGMCGSDSHNNRVCIQATNGMLLPSTISYEMSGVIPRDPVFDSRVDSVCVTYATRPRDGADGFGQKGYSSVDKFSFSVRELVPRAQ